MTGTNHLAFKLALVAIVAIGTMLLEQFALPLHGQGVAQAVQEQAAQGQRGGRGQVAAITPTVSPVAAISTLVTQPGPMFESLMELKAGDDMAYFKYETSEYFVSGTANGQPYKTRIVIRKPSDNSKFSGLILVESMHPSGNAWMFHRTHRYSMTSGHIAIDILTSDPAGVFARHNPGRYRDLLIGNEQASEIIAQVGALIKSKQGGNPLAALPVRKMVLAGTSASSGVLINYLPTHMALRLSDMKPIYDGFLPTSNGANIRQIDVPLIQVPTMTEVQGGNVTTRQDGDDPGNQYRNYEFAGMAHIDSRDAAVFYPDPCKYPISRFPMAAYTSVALNHLFDWVDKGVVPPRADRIWVDRNSANDGSLMALDEYGNASGGVRNPYVDVPTMKYGVPNEAAAPPIKDPHPRMALLGEAALNQQCGLVGYQIAMSPAQLKQLHKDKKTYQIKVEQKYDELMRQGWALPLYRDIVIGDAATVNF